MSDEAAANMLEVVLGDGWSIQHGYRNYTDGKFKFALMRDIRGGTRGVKAEGNTLLEAITSALECALDRHI